MRKDFLTEVYTYISKKLRLEMTALTFRYHSYGVLDYVTNYMVRRSEGCNFHRCKESCFGNRIGDEVFTIAEPEAAAIATLKRFTTKRFKCH